MREVGHALAWRSAGLPAGVWPEYAFAVTPYEQRKVSAAELRAMFASGEVSGESYVCAQDGVTTSWSQIQALEALHGYLRA